MKKFYTLAAAFMLVATFVNEPSSAIAQLVTVQKQMPVFKASATTVSLDKTSDTYFKGSNKKISVSTNFVVTQIKTDGPSSVPNTWVKSSSSAPNTYTFDPVEIEKLKLGTYTVSFTNSANQSAFFILEVSENKLVLSSEEGVYTQNSGASLSVLNVGETKFISSSRPFAKISSDNNNEVKFSTQEMDKLSVGLYEIEFVDGNGKAATYKLEIKPSELLPGMYPSSGTYVVKSDIPLSSTASRNIQSVAADKLVAGDWKISGKTLTFDTARLNGYPSGSYDLKVILDDNSLAVYTVTVIDNSVTADTWKESTLEFNKNMSTGKFVDYELMSSAPITGVGQFTIGNKVIPKKDYFVLGTSIIVDKNYLATLKDDLYRVSLEYNSGKTVVFYLEISSDLPTNGTSEEVTC